MPALTGTQTPGSSAGAGITVTLSVTSPVGAVGALQWQLGYKGRFEDGWKMYHAKLSGSDLITKAPFPSKRALLFVRCIDSTGQVFDSTPVAYHPKDVSVATKFTQIIHTASNLGIGETGKQKVTAYNVLNGNVVPGFLSAGREMEAPLGSGMTYTPTLQAWNVKDYANTAPVTGREGKYRAGFAF